MKIVDIQAAQLQPDMIIVPTLRTMRYRRVESIKTTGIEFFSTSFNTGSVKVNVKGLCNHGGPIMVVQTDCGPMSLNPAQTVRVLIDEGE